MSKFRLVEVPLECVMLVPVGIGTSSLVILDHPSGLKALWFEGGKLDRMEDIDEVETFEEAVKYAK